LPEAVEYALNALADPRDLPPAVGTGQLEASLRAAVDHATNGHLDSSATAATGRATAAVRVACAHLSLGDPCEAYLVLLAAENVLVAHPRERPVVDHLVTAPRPPRHRVRVMTGLAPRPGERCADRGSPRAMDTDVADREHSERVAAPVSAVESVAGRAPPSVALTELRGARREEVVTRAASEARPSSAGFQEPSAAVRTWDQGCVVVALAGPAGRAWVEDLRVLLRDLRPRASIELTLELSGLTDCHHTLSRLLGRTRIQHLIDGARVELRNPPPALAADIDAQAVEFTVTDNPMTASRWRAGPLRGAGDRADVGGAVDDVPAEVGQACTAAAGVAAQQGERLLRGDAGVTAENSLACSMMTASTRSRANAMLGT
jgi:hypothetical protein